MVLSATQTHGGQERLARLPNRDSPRACLARDALRFSNFPGFPVSNVH